MLQNGANPLTITTENERPIDLCDQYDLPLISLLLNNMKIWRDQEIKQNIKNDSQKTTNHSSENDDESPNNQDLFDDNFFYFNKVFITIIKSNSDLKTIISEIDVIV